MKKLYFLPVLIIACFLKQSSATTYSTISDGNWMTDSIWAGGVAPSLTPVDTIYINNEVNYGNTQLVLYDYLEITASGKLYTDRNKPTNVHPFATLVNYGELNVPNLIVNGTYHNYNYTFAASFTNGTSGKIYNHTGAEFESTGQVNNSGTIYNDGLMNSPGVFVNNSGTLSGNGGEYIIDANLVSNSDAQIVCSGPEGIDICSSTGETPSSVITSSGFLDSSCVTICGVLLSSTTLPITLVSFKAEPNVDGAVDIKWTTATEINNDYFEVQRSYDGVNFQTINIIDGAGNSSITLNYHTTDLPPVQNTVYYRLGQVDFDGTATYSDLVAVETSHAIIGFSVVPNPSKGIFTINLDNITADNVNITIFNGLGQAVWVETLVSEPGASYSQKVNLANVLPTGSYFMSVTSGQETLIKKLILE